MKKKLSISYLLSFEDLLLDILKIRKKAMFHMTGPYCACVFYTNILIFFNFMGTNS